MGLSDCPVCWDTPCCCGWEYIFYSDAKLNEYLEAIWKAKRFTNRHGKQDRMGLKGKEYKDIKAKWREFK